MQGNRTAPTLLVPDLLAHQSAYNASRFGHRFVATDQTPNAPATAQVGFSATTPTFLFLQSGSSRRIIFRSFTASHTANSGGSSVRCIVAIDTAARTAAGGTAVTPQNLNTESSIVSATSFIVNPTVIAPGAGTRYITHVSFPTTSGSNLMLNYGDGVLIGPTGSLLIYLFATVGTAPALLYTAEWSEVP